MLGSISNQISTYSLNQMEQPVITEAPSEGIQMEFITSDSSPSSSVHQIYFNGGGASLHLMKKDKFNTILEEELSWGSEKISSIASSYPEPVLVTPKECSLLQKRFVSDLIKEQEAITTTTCGFKMMVAIKKDALENQSQYDFMSEILKDSPLVESVRFLTFWE